MANLFLDLPLPAGDGAGASVDVSALGARKTFQVAGSYNCTVTVEGSNDGGTTWVPIVAFASPPGKRTLSCAVQFMRVRIANLIGGLLPDSVAVSSNDDGGSFVNLPATAGAGTGANADVSALGTLNTVLVTGTFTGTVVIEISDDGTDFVDCMTFAAPGFQTKEFTAQFMRVRRANPTAIPGLPVVNVGAIADASGGGGGGGGVNDVFVLRPGGVAGDNVFTDWASAYAALNAVAGKRTLQFDDNLGAIAIPSGTWNMTNVRWFGVPQNPAGDSLPRVSIDDGAQFPGLRWITGLDIINNATSVSPVTITGAQSELGSFTIDGGAQIGVGVGQQGVGTVPFIEDQFGLLYYLIDGAILGETTNNAPALGFTGTGFGFVSLLNGSFLAFGSSQGVSVDAGAGVFIAADNTSAANEGNVTGAGTILVDTGFWGDNFRYFADDSLNTTANRNADLGRVHRQNTTAAPHTVTLPAIGTNLSKGRIVGVKNETGGNNVTVAIQAGDTLDNVVNGTDTLAPGESAVYIVASPGVWTTLADSRVGGGIQSVELIESATPGSSFPTSGADYTPIAPGGAAPAIEWQYGAPGNFAIDVLYSMSVANAGDVSLRLDRLVIGEGANPDAALVGGTVETFTPGNDTNSHLLQSANFQVTASAGDEVRFSLNRPAGDTHPGDIRIIGLRVRSL
jgi:hypothetical protein